MSGSFRVYIDESGDEGFTFRPNSSGSSEWFVLSALVVRTNNDASLVSMMAKMRRDLGRKQNSPLHFVEMLHGHRVAWVKSICVCPIRTISILIHKPSIDDPEFYKSTKFHLYHYASRLLIERVSWFCRDHYDPSRGNGVADVIFSNRRKMSYDAIRSYWSKLKNDPTIQAEVRIDWKHIDPLAMCAVNHDQLAGLQIADCVASSHWQAVSMDRFGNNEPRYLLELKKHIYRHKKTSDGYGLKFWPKLQKLRPSNPHLSVFDSL